MSNIAFRGVLSFDLRKSTRLLNSQALNYNIYRKTTEIGWFSCWSSILIELEFGVLVFVEEEIRRTGENLYSKARTKNKLNPHCWEASAITIAPTYSLLINYYNADSLS